MVAGRAAERGAIGAAMSGTERVAVRAAVRTAMTEAVRVAAAVRARVLPGGCSDSYPLPATPVSAPALSGYKGRHFFKYNYTVDDPGSLEYTVLFCVHL